MTLPIETAGSSSPGFSELGPGRLEAVYVAAGAVTWCPPVQVQFGLGGGKGLWHRLDRLRDGLPTRKGFVAVRPDLEVEVKSSAATGPAGSATACCCRCRPR